MKIRFVLGFVLTLYLAISAEAQSVDDKYSIDPKGRHPDVLVYDRIFEKPDISEGTPQAGKLVRQYLTGLEDHDLHHLLYLPTNWSPTQRFPVIFEYNGQGAYVDQTAANGFGISGGRDFIWVVLPYVSEDNLSETNDWWGKKENTVEYAKKAIKLICQNWGGDSTQLVLTGMSRGSIACNYIGLHDDEIASLWAAMIPVSHYDGRPDWHWSMSQEDATIGAITRLRRLNDTPQLICGEYHLRHNHTDANDLKAVRDGNYSDMKLAIKELDLIPLSQREYTKAFVQIYFPEGDITFLDLPFVNHTNQWLFMDVPERELVRMWLMEKLKMNPDK